MNAKVTINNNTVGIVNTDAVFTNYFMSTKAIFAIDGNMLSISDQYNITNDDPYIDELALVSVNCFSMNGIEISGVDRDGSNCVYSVNIRQNEIIKVRTNGVTSYDKDVGFTVLCPWCRDSGVIGEPVCITCCGDGVIPAKDL